MKNKLSLIVIFAFFLLSASSKNVTKKWIDCSMTDTQNTTIYKHCIVYSTIYNSTQRYIMCMPWVDPEINPICTIQLICKNKAIYSTHSRQDTVVVDIRIAKNEKGIIQIIFPPQSIYKSNLTITLNRSK